MNERRPDKPGVKIAAIFWICMMTAYTLMGVVWIYFEVSLALCVNIAFSGICVGIALRREQGIASLGFTKETLRYSCKIGLICSGVIVILNGVLPGLLHGNELASPTSILLWLAYYIFVIALPEEIIFRGFLLTELETAMGSSKKAILVSGVFFMLIHVPYQFIVSGMDPVAYLMNGNLFTLIMTFIWHLVFCWLFRKTQALYGAILFHGFMDWSNMLFI